MQIETWMAGGGRERGGYSLRSRSLETIDPRIPTMRGRRASGFRRPGRHRGGRGRRDSPTDMYV